MMKFSEFLKKLTKEQVNIWWDSIAPENAPKNIEENNWKYKLAKNNKSLPFKWAIDELAKYYNIDFSKKDFDSNVSNRDTFSDAFDFEIEEDLVYDTSEFSSFKKFYLKFTITHHQLFQHFNNYIHQLLIDNQVNPYKIRMALRDSDKEAMVIIGMRATQSFRINNGKAFLAFIVKDSVLNIIPENKIISKEQFTGKDTNKWLIRFEVEKWDDIPTSILESNTQCFSEEYNSIKNTKRATWNSEANSTNSALKYVSFKDIVIEDWISKNEMNEMENIRYWGLGFGDDYGRLQKFKTENYWQALDYDDNDKSGVAEQARKCFNQIKKGDFVIIKGLGGKFDLVVHYKGLVESVNLSEKRINLQRLDGELYKGKAPSGKNAGNWFSTIVEVKRKQDIDMLFNNIKTINQFTWVKTHQEISQYLLNKENSQTELISILKKVGATIFNDKDDDGNQIDLEVIEPFTFYAYIYKYGNEKRLEILQNIAKELGLHFPSDEAGVPSSNAQNVWFFPYKNSRKNNEVSRLWNFFRKVLANSLTNDDFKDILSINSIGKAKLTEGLFDIMPDVYFPLNKPTKPFLKEVYGIDSNFNTYQDYLDILNLLRSKTKTPFYQLSYEAWLWNTDKSTKKKSITENNNYKSMHPLNQILYGPPGTGKTYNTINKALEIITGQIPNSYKDAVDIFNKNLNNQIEFITFHQSYSYEDFIQGLRPDIENGKELSFEKKDGIFKRIADRALANLKASKDPLSQKKPFEFVFNQLIEPLNNMEVNELNIKMKKSSFFITEVGEKSIAFRKNIGDSEHTLSIDTLKKMYDKGENDLILGGLQPYYNPILELLLEKGKKNLTKVELKNYVIVIDEINRANISRVFGELITLIEEDKRSEGEIPLSVTLPSGDSFIVPSNLYIIGTMNTADKSIALLDIALRRRFEFVPYYPNHLTEGVKDGFLLEKINAEIQKRKGYDFTIGHAYFMGENYSLEKTINNKVIPLLLEYFMNDEREIISILKACDIELEGWPMKMKTL